MATRITASRSVLKTSFDRLADERCGVVNDLVIRSLRGTGL